VGFKNGTHGDTGIAIDAIRAAGHAHAFLSPNNEGILSLYRTTGNQDAHLILRGGSEPNYDTSSVSKAYAAQKEVGLKRRIMIDCSHANSGKDIHKQVAVVKEVASRLSSESNMIGGVMIESFLVEGNQSTDATDLVYGQSITDACIGWDDTKDLLNLLGI